MSGFYLRLVLVAVMLVAVDVLTAWDMSENSITHALIFVAAATVIAKLEELRERSK